MAAMSNGIAIGGLLPVLVNLVLLTTDADEEVAGFGCFTFGAIFVLMVFLLFLRMEKLSLYKHFTSLNHSDHSEKGEKEVEGE